MSTVLWQELLDGMVERGSTEGEWSVSAALVKLSACGNFLHTKLDMNISVDCVL